MHTDQAGLSFEGGAEVDLEDAIAFSNRIEKILLKHYGAYGSGFLKMVSSVKHKLTAQQIKYLRTIGAIRNQLVHGDLLPKDIPNEYKHFSRYIISSLEPPAQLCIPEDAEECAALLIPKLRMALPKAAISIDDSGDIFIEAGRVYTIPVPYGGAGVFATSSMIEASASPELALIQDDPDVIRECAFFAQSWTLCARFVTDELDRPPIGSIFCHVDSFHPDLSSLAAAVGRYMSEIDSAIRIFCGEAERIKSRRPFSPCEPRK